MSVSVALTFLAAWAALMLAITSLKGLIVTTREQELAQLQAIKAQLIKAAGEITAKIQALTDAVGNAGNTTPEIDAAIADLQTTAQALDDVVPDAPAESPAEPPAP